MLCAGVRKVLTHPLSRPWPKTATHGRIRTPPIRGAQTRTNAQEEKKERAKLAKAIEKGNQETANIYAENAIRQKQAALNYLRMSSRVDAVASRLDQAIKMKQVTRAMGRITKGLEKSMENMSLEQITMVMEKAEEVFTDLDVQASVVEGAMSGTTATAANPDSVKALMSEVAEANGLELADQFDSDGMRTSKKTAAAEEDDLAARLKNLSA